jgi:hypothetical protein
VKEIGRDTLYMYVSVKKRRHGKLAKCFVRRDCALYLRGEARPGTWNARQCRARLLRDGHAQGQALAVAGCWGRMMVTFEVPAGVVEGLPMPQPAIPAATAPVATSNRQSCKYHRFGERFRLRPIAASPAIPPGSQKTIAGRCHAVLKSRNMFSRGGDSQCNTLHRLSPSGAGEVSLVSDDFALF